MKRECSKCEYVKFYSPRGPLCFHPCWRDATKPAIMPDYRSQVRNLKPNEVLLFDCEAPKWCPLPRVPEDPRLRDNRFVPEKVWTRDEMQLGVYNYMDGVLQYIKSVLEFQVRLLRRTSVPDIPEKIWALYVKDWVGHINLTLSPKVSVQLQGTNLRSEPMGSYLNVFVVVGWAEYPPTINQLTIGIE